MNIRAEALYLHFQLGNICLRNLTDKLLQANWFSVKEYLFSELLAIYGITAKYCSPTNL